MLYGDERTMTRKVGDVPTYKWGGTNLGNMKELFIDELE